MRRLHLGPVAAAFGGPPRSWTSACGPRARVPAGARELLRGIDRCKPVIDVGFHIGVTDSRAARAPGAGEAARRGDHLVQALHGLHGRGHGRRRDALQDDAGRERDRRLVMVHAENGDAIDVIVKEAVAAGKADPIWHARTRPKETEAEATNRAIQLTVANSASTSSTFLPARGRADRARPGQGLDRRGETCTQYLFVDDRARKAELGRREVDPTPPPRPKAERSTCGRRPERRPLGGLDRSLPVQLAGAEGDQRPRLPGHPSGGRDREPAPCSTSLASAPGGSR